MQINYWRFKANIVTTKMRECARMSEIIMHFLIILKSKYNVATERTPGQARNVQEEVCMRLMLSPSQD